VADTKISALTDGTTADATDKIPVERGGANRYVTPAYISTYIDSIAHTLTSAAPQLTLGVNATTLGSIKLFGNTSGDATLRPTAAAGTATTITLPATTTTLAGLAVAQTFTAQNTFAAGTITTSQPTTFTQTWNAGAVTFSAFTLNVTDTASAAASLLADWQVGGSSRFSISKAGVVTFLQQSSAPSLVSSASSNSGFGSVSGNPVVYESGTTLMRMTGGITVIANPLCLSSTTSTLDTYLRSDAANELTLRNSTTAQIFNLYRTYTNASNYQRLNHSWNTSTALIMNQGLGTGTDGNIAFNDAALATSATVGYVMIPSCAGAPTGVPADIPTGQVALHFDTTNNKIYVYDGGWLSTAALT